MLIGKFMEVHLLQHIWIWLDTQEILVSVETRGKRDTGFCILMAMNETKRKVSENSPQLITFHVVLIIALDFYYFKFISHMISFGRKHFLLEFFFLYILNLILRYLVKEGIISFIILYSLMVILLLPYYNLLEDLMT